MGNTKLNWKDTSRHPQNGPVSISFDANVCGYQANVHHHIDYGDEWLLTCRDFGIDKALLGNDSEAPLEKAEQVLAAALQKAQDFCSEALALLGEPTTVSVETPLGQFIAFEMQNKNLPGVAIDLIPVNGNSRCNLMCVQPDDDGNLQAMLYAEIASNANDGSGSGEHSHCYVVFRKPGEAPQGGTNADWIHRMSREELCMAANYYEHLIAEEIIISRMEELGYHDPKANHPTALNDAVCKYLENKANGHNEDFSLQNALPLSRRLEMRIIKCPCCDRMFDLDNCDTDKYWDNDGNHILEYICPNCKYRIPHPEALQMLKNPY